MSVKVRLSTIRRSGYGAEVFRLQRILLDHGYMASPVEAEVIWESYSRSMCAGWMVMDPDDAVVWTCMQPYIANEDDNLHSH